VKGTDTDCGCAHRLFTVCSGSKKILTACI